MDDTRRAALEALAAGLVAGDPGALEAAGSLTPEELEYVSAAMRAAADPAPESATLALGVATLPAPEPDATGDTGEERKPDTGKRAPEAREGFLGARVAALEERVTALETPGPAAADPIEPAPIEPAPIEPDPIEPVAPGGT